MCILESGKKLLSDDQMCWGVTFNTRACWSRSTFWQLPFVGRSLILFMYNLSSLLHSFLLGLFWSCHLLFISLLVFLHVRPFCSSFYSSVLEWWEHVRRKNSVGFFRWVVFPSSCINLSIQEVRVQKAACSSLVNLSWFPLINGWQEVATWNCNSSSSMLVFIF